MKTVLYIGPQALEYWQRSAAGWQRLAQAPTGPVWAVTDLAEESVTQVAVPRVYGRDRSAWLQRQLASRFPDTPFRGALPGPTGRGLIERLAPPRQCLLAVDAAQRIQAVLDANAAPLAGLWSGAMLLSQLGRHPSLPPDLFIVLPHNGHLRIAFLKDRLPLLFRLAPAGDQPADQVSEIVRTLRHLESTRAVDSGQRHAVWLLGPADDMGAALQAQGLDLLPAASWIKAPADWRMLLFDLALTSPPGQLAPQGLRGQFLAHRLRRAAYGLSAASVALTLWGASVQLRDGMQAQRQRARTLTELAQGAQDQAAMEQDIDRFGVAPPLLRHAIRLDEDEVTAVPGMPEALTRVAAILGRSGPHRVSRLEWRLLPAREPACVKAAQAAGDATLANDAPPDADEHRAELEVVLQAEPEGGNGGSRQLLGVSTGFAQWPGATLWLDPVRRAASGVLSSAATIEAKPPTWCLSLAPARSAPFAP